MSLPTYVRHRRVANPADYILQRLAADNARNGKGECDPGEVYRILQLRKQWEDDYDGYYINPVKPHVRPFWLLPSREDEKLIRLTAAGTAGDTAKLIEFKIDTQGHFEAAYLMFKATSPDFFVEILDGGNNQAGFQNSEIHASTIAGDAKRPFTLPETWFFNTQDAPRSIFMNFRNRSAAPNDIRWVFAGRRWYHKESPYIVQEAIERRFLRTEKTYTYFLTNQPFPTPSAPPGIPIAAGASVIENAAPIFKATNEADTEIYKLMIFAVDDQGADADFTFALREQQSGRTLSDGQVHVSNGWGDGQFPFVLPETFLFQRNYELIFEITSLSANPITIFPTLCGRRLQYA